MSAQKNDFQFLEPGELVDGDLELILAHKSPADDAKAVERRNEAGYMA